MPKNKGKVCRPRFYYPAFTPAPTQRTPTTPADAADDAVGLFSGAKQHSVLYLFIQFANSPFFLQGGKNRRRGKNENDNEKRELTFKEEGQEYAQVVKMLGNGRLEALCFDGEKRLAHIRGKLRKKVWINQGDIILLSLRDYQDEKGDVILKYSADEARSLKAYGELPESAKINETDTYGHEGLDDNVEFDEDREGSADEKEVDIDEL
jgi:translation initiation factor 1A